MHCCQVTVRSKPVAFHRFCTAGDRLAVGHAPPMRFMAMAMVSCVSREMAPSDMPPVQKRVMMSAADSTCICMRSVSANTSFL